MLESNNIIEVNHNASCNVLYKREPFINEGGFWESLWPGEDVELDYRMRKKGYKLVFNPKGMVFHYRAENFKSFSKMMFRYGRAQGILVKKYGFFRKIHLLPFFVLFIIILFILSIFLSFLPLFLIFIALGLLLFLVYFRFNLSVFMLIFPSFLS